MSYPCACSEAEACRQLGMQVPGGTAAPGEGKTATVSARKRKEVTAAKGTAAKKEAAGQGARAKDKAK